MANTITPVLTQSGRRLVHLRPEDFVEVDSDEI